MDKGSVHCLLNITITEHFNSPKCVCDLRLISKGFLNKYVIISSYCVLVSLTMSCTSNILGSKKKLTFFQNELKILKLINIIVLANNKSSNYLRKLPTNTLTVDCEVSLYKVHE